MSERTPEQIKAAKLQIEAFLDGLPKALDNPYYHAATLNALEKTLNKLKAFVRFLSNLNPLNYKNWMLKAFANYVPNTQMTNTVVESVAITKTTPTVYTPDNQPENNLKETPTPRYNA